MLLYQLLVTRSRGGNPAASGNQVMGQKTPGGFPPGRGSASSLPCDREGKPTLRPKRMFCPVHPQRDLKVYRKRVSSGRVRYKQLSTLKRIKKLPDRLHGLCARPIPL
jgi:hypothetical protein